MGCTGKNTTEVKEDTGKQYNVIVNEKEKNKEKESQEARYDYAVLERDYEVIGVEAADGEECDEEEGCEPEDVY